MTPLVPTGAPVARQEGILRLLRTASVGGAAAFVWLVVASELVALALALLARTYGVWTWAKVGLLAAAAALRADVVATVEGGPFFAEPAPGATYHWRLVPSLLTIGFLVLAARVGRRASATRPDGSAVAVIGLSAVGAGIPVGILAAAAASFVDVSFPSIGTTIRVDPARAALWGGITAAAAAAVGAAFGRRRSPLRASLRGGVSGYGCALLLVTAGAVVVATLEPTATRAYLDALLGIGSGGTVLLGVHLLSAPTLAALVLAPATGACVGMVSAAGAVDLCPWSLTPAGPGGLLLAQPLSLSPVLWVFAVVPPLSAAVAGHRATAEWAEGSPIASGIGGAMVFAGLAVAGSWYAGARVPVIVIPEVVVRADLVTMSAALALWAVIGGTIGGWLAGRRRYEEPVPPSPTSA